MFTIRLGDIEVGRTSLQGGDPPMGVASGAIEFSCSSGEESRFLRHLGATIESSGLLVIREQPNLSVFDDRELRIQSDHCYLVYSEETGESLIEACGIPAKEYETRFPKQWRSYHENFT